MATYQPTVQAGPITFDQLLKQFYGYVDYAQAQISYYLKPSGNYSGLSSGSLTPDNQNIINPWGTAATAILSADNVRGQPEYSLSLPASTSYSFSAGKYDDPNLAASTAQGLNDATNQRAINQAGLSATSNTSARSSQSVLATLDQMYLGSLRTSVATSNTLGGIQQAGAIGFNEGSNKTILGSTTDASKPPATTTALKRALT